MSIREQLQREAVFSSLGRHLSVANSPKDAARVIVDAAQNLIGWDACSLDLHLPDSGHTEPILRVKIVHGQWVEAAPVHAEGETAFLTRQAIVDGAKLVARESLPEEPGITSEPGRESGRPASLMFVPIRYGEKICGVLSIRRYQPNAYCEEDLTTLQALADHCGGALERIRGREALVEAERKYRSIFENAVEGIFQSTPAGKYVTVNPGFARILGYASPEAMIRDITDIGRQVYVDAARREAFRRQIEQEGFVVDFEHEALRKDGTRAWLSLNARVIRDAAGQVLLYEGTIEDITERRRTEARNAAFSELGRRLSAALSARQAGQIIIDIADRLVGWEACTLDLYAPETRHIHNVLNMDTINGQRVDCLPAYDGQEPSPGVRQVLERGPELILREPPFMMPGDLVPFGDTQRASASLMFVPVRDGEKVIGILSIQSYTARAYTEQDLLTLQSLADHCGGALNRIRTRDALAQAEEKYRNIFENAVEGIYQTTPEGRFLSVNPAMARVFGYASPDQMIHERTDIGQQGYVDPAKREEFKRRIEEKGVVTDFEYEARRNDGSRVWVSESARAVRDATGRILFYEGRLQDITARKKLEDQLRQSQKMEAIGQLAGGVAHDFNNLLTVIQGRAGMLLLEDGLSSRAQEAVGEIALSAERASSLTRQLLAFSRRQVMQPVPLHLNQVVANVTKMLQRILGEDIALEVKCSLKDPRIKADPGMLEQIPLNLAVNSRDAMPNGGRLIISTGELLADEDYARVNPEASAGAFACLEVSDTGCGIPAEHLRMIFEPFFTTKEVGKGTGLGLATVYGIVKQHQGWIKVYSEVGHGTTFRIFLPTSSEQPTGKTDLAPTKARGGTETVLVVEDTPCVIELVRCVLERYGYEVLEAADGPAALELWQNHGARIQLLLTDMVMPNGMTGLELADKLQAEKPDLKVIYTSGYSADVVAPGFLLNEEVNFLQKPYNPLKLAQTVRQCLDTAVVRAVPCDPVSA